MDYMISDPIEQIRLLKNRAYALSRKKYLPSEIAAIRWDLMRIRCSSIFAEPDKSIMFSSEILKVNQLIQEMELHLRFNPSIRMDISQGGEEWVGFGKQKLAQIKDMMIQNGIDIYRREWQMDEDINILVQSHKGYDLIRIESEPTGFYVVYGYLDITTINQEGVYVYNTKLKQLIFEVIPDKESVSGKAIRVNMLTNSKIADSSLDYIFYQSYSGKSGFVSNNTQTSHRATFPQPSTDAYIRNYGLLVNNTAGGMGLRLYGSIYVFTPINFIEKPEDVTIWDFITHNPSDANFSYGYSSYYPWAYGRHNYSLDNDGNLLYKDEGAYYKRSTGESLIRGYYNNGFADISNLGKATPYATLGNGKAITSSSTSINYYSHTPSTVYARTVPRIHVVMQIAHFISPPIPPIKETATVTYDVDWTYGGATEGSTIQNNGNETVYKIGGNSFPHSGEISHKYNYSSTGGFLYWMPGYIDILDYSKLPEGWFFDKLISTTLIPAPEGEITSTEIDTDTNNSVSILDFDNYNGDNNYALLYRYLTYESKTTSVSSGGNTTMSTSKSRSSKCGLYYNVGGQSGDISIDVATATGDDSIQTTIDNASVQIYQDKLIVYTIRISNENGVKVIMGIVNIGMENFDAEHKQITLPLDFIPPEGFTYTTPDSNKFIGIHFGSIINKEEGE